MNVESWGESREGPGGRKFHCRQQVHKGIEPARENYFASG